MIRRIVAGLVVLSGVVVLLVGVPWLLLTAAGAPWTWSIPSWDQLYWAVRQGNITASAIITVLAAIAWLAWADLIWSILWEFIVNVPRLARGQVPRAVPAGVGPIERLARKLVLSTLAISAIVSAASPATASAPSLATLSSLRADPGRAVATVQHVDEVTTNTDESSAWTQQAWVVQRGDSLWDVAELTLGDGARVDDLIALNPGLEHVSRLIEGQRILLPPDARPIERAVEHSLAAEPTAAAPTELDANGPSAGVPSVTVHIVEPGESLWSIADDELGDGFRWHEIYDANNGRQFDDGRQLVDPDLIQPGWDLRLAAPEVATISPTPAPPPEPAIESASIPTPTPLPAPVVATRADDDAAGSVDAQVPDAAPALPSSRWITPSGVEPAHAAASSSSIVHLATAARELMLAGGVLTLVAVRRRRRLRSTRPRSRLVQPAARVRDTEQSLRAVEPGGRLARLDVAVRAATLPMVEHERRIVAVVFDADGQIRLLPDEPIELDSPWSSENGWLALSPAVPLELLAPAARRAGIACPTLVQIGVDGDGGAVFVDLEACEAIEIEPAGGQGDEIVTALAATLSTSTLAEACTILTVALDSRATFDHPGATEVADADAAIERARAAVGSTSRADATTFELRGRGTSGELWEPAVVFVGSSVDPIRLPIDRRGLAIVASSPLMGPSQRFAPDPDNPGMWKLAPLGLVVHPVRVDEARLRELDELARSADIPIEANDATDPDDLSAIDAFADRDTDRELAVGPVAGAPSTGSVSHPDAAASAALPGWVESARATQLDDDATLVPPPIIGLEPGSLVGADPGGGSVDGAGHEFGPITEIGLAAPDTSTRERSEPDLAASDAVGSEVAEPNDVTTAALPTGDPYGGTVEPAAARSTTIETGHRDAAMIPPLEGELEGDLGDEVDPGELVKSEELFEPGEAGERDEPVDSRSLPADPVGARRADIESETESVAIPSGAVEPVDVELADGETTLAGPTFLVRLFGGVEVVGADGETVEFRRSKSLELVAWLALHRGRRSTRVAARTALWSEDVRDATFANVVSDARRSLARVAEPPPDEEWVGRTLTESLPLHDDVWTDADMVSQALERACSQSPPEAITTLQPAVELIGGFPFASTTYLWPDAEGITSNLVVLATTVTCELAAHYLSTGNAAGVFDATARGLAVIPAHEELIGLRMQAHAMVGDHGGVRAEWESYERAINADLWSDGEPSPKLVNLRHELLSGSAA